MFMKKKDASFWSDIKALDERLARDPDSFCFSRLSEIYLKVGLIADALHTARSGVAKHPGYLAGQRALGMASYASGLHDECRVILEKVTAAMPEDVDAQKVLAILYVVAGDHASAMQTYRTVLDFKPDDAVCAAELETLTQGGTPSLSVAYPARAEAPFDTSVVASSADEIIDLTEIDIYEEPAEEVISVAAPLVESGATIGHHDPLSTLTLAELYEQQGFVSKALDIYRTILADNPDNAKILDRIAQLEGHEPVPENILEEEITEDYEDESDYAEPVADEDVTAAFESPVFEPALESSFEPDSSETVAFDDVPVPLEAHVFEPVADVVEPEVSVSEVQEYVPASLESVAFAPLAHQSADNVVEILDGWLENIRRIKACR
jgi:tetratricopeptide (TPR) repeat protein